MANFKSHGYLLEALYLQCKYSHRARTVDAKVLLSKVKHLGNVWLVSLGNLHHSFGMLSFSTINGASKRSTLSITSVL